VVIGSVNYFRRTDNSGIKAYEILVEALQYNQNSAALWENYVLECVKQDFTNYADQGISRLNNMLSEKELSEFNVKLRKWQERYSKKGF
jgi:hypothetical protein